MGKVVRRTGPPGREKPKWVKAKPRGWYPDSVVERVIKEFFDGNAADMRRKIEELSGKKLSNQQIAFWRERGQFPIEWIDYVHNFTKLPYRDLLTRRRPRVK